MEATQSPKSRPGPEGRPAPVEALERPQNLKKWASDLTRILQGQEDALFEGWGFDRGKLTRDDFARILKKMTGCGSVVELRAALDRKTGEMGAPVVHAANFCGQHTICPYCAGRVQDRRGVRFGEPIAAMAVKYKYAYMVTATLPPRPTWRDDLDQLIAAWQGFRRMGQVRKRRRKDGTVRETRSRGEWGKVRAGLAKIELKRGARSGLPHCHYHALIFTADPLDYRVWNPRDKHLDLDKRRPLYKLPRPVGYAARFRAVSPGWGARAALRGWVPGSKLTAEWFKASGGAINFRVDPIRYRPADEKKGRSWAESVVDQSREVLKYATKFDSKPSADNLALFARDFVGIRDATYQRRLFVSYGDFRSVGGNDFDGGGPHISEGPAIFESRWRGVEYSPLIPRTRPVFLNTDKTPAVTARLTVLNRAQGQVRRMRFAVLASRDHYRETGGLRPAWYMRHVPRAGGGFDEVPQALEVPAYIVAAPANMANWERWLDETMESGRTYYAAVRESLSIESLEHLDGTIEEETAIRDLAARLWRRSDEYAAEVTRIFIRTLNRTQESIHGPP